MKYYYLFGNETLWIIISIFSIKTQQPFFFFCILLSYNWKDQIKESNHKLYMIFIHLILPRVAKKTYLTFYFTDVKCKVRYVFSAQCGKIILFRILRKLCNQKGYYNRNGWLRGEMVINFVINYWIWLVRFQMTNFILNQSLKLLQIKNNNSYLKGVYWIILERATSPSQV